MKTALKIFAWVAGVTIVLKLALLIFLNCGAAERLATRYCRQYLDADLDFDKLSVSIVKRFPNFALRLENVSITDGTCPCDSIMTCHRLMMEGGDTLAHFDYGMASINLWSLLRGTIHIPAVRLDNSRVWFKFFDDTTCNWAVLSGPSGDDSTDFSMPDIVIERLALGGDTHAVFCDKEDTVYAEVNSRGMRFRGRIPLAKPYRSHGRFRCDSLTAYTEFKTDTLSLFLEKAGLRGDNEQFELTLETCADAYLRKYGHVTIPLSLKATAALPEDSVFTVKLFPASGNAAGIPFSAEGTFSFLQEGISLDAAASIDSCPLGELADNYASKFIAGWPDIRTDAHLTASLTAEGMLNPADSIYPAINGILSVPYSSVVFDGLKFKAGAGAHICDTLTLDAFVDSIAVDGEGLHISATGGVTDLLGEDPSYDIDASFSADADSVSRILPEGIYAEGLLKGSITGHLLQSQLSISRIAEADLNGFVSSNRLSASIPKDTINAVINGLDVKLSSEDNKYDDSLKDNARTLNLSADIDSVRAVLGSSMSMYGKRMSLRAQESGEVLKNQNIASQPLVGILKAETFFLKDSDSLALSIKNSTDSFRLRFSGEKKVPSLSIRSNNGIILLKHPSAMLRASSLSFSASATKTAFKKDRPGRRYLPDSLRRTTRAAGDSVSGMLALMPKWLKDEDFRKKDLNFSLNESLTKYFKTWSFKGDVNLGTASVLTPLFPTSTMITGFNGNIDNDKVVIDSIRINSGSSDITAKGSVSGLSTALLGKGFYKVDLGVTSDNIDIDEIMATAARGASLSASGTTISDVTDENAPVFEADSLQVTPDSLSAILVIPANIIADIKLKAGNIHMTPLDLKQLNTDIAIRERCLQLTNSAASSDIGKIYLEGFYSTQAKDDLKAGVYLVLDDVTVEKVMDMFPEFEQTLPLLKSFSGNLNCQVAATTRFDTGMNILTPTISGVARISGNDLQIVDDDTVKQIARLLLFREHNLVHVDALSVEGTISDNVLEVFPFVLDIDRYRLAMGGLQNLDSSFKYHMSVLKSPLPFKLGLDLSGKADSKTKYKLGKAKYRRVSDVPVFTTVIKESTMNLIQSIHDIFNKGVERAVAENEEQKLILDKKAELKYVNAAEMPQDTLSASDLKKIQLYEELPDSLKEESMDTTRFEQLLREQEVADSIKKSVPDSTGIRNGINLFKKRKQSTSDQEI